MSCSLSLALRLFCFCFVFVFFALIEAAVLRSIVPRYARDGTAEFVSRDQILRHERGQGNINFSCSADHVQDWQPYPVDPYSCYMCNHTCMRSGSHTQFYLTTVCFLGVVEIFCTIAVFPFVWRVSWTFFLSGVFFYLVTTGWILTSVYVRIQSFRGIHSMER